MSTGKNFLETNVRSTLENFCNTFSGQLSEWLMENKSIEISPEELCAALDVPFKAPQTPSLPAGSSIQTKMPNLPDYYSGTGMTTPKKRGGRTKKATDPSLPNCEYTLARGKFQGEKCKNQVLGDGSAGADRFCKQCLKKTAVKGLLDETPSKSTVQPPVIPGSVVSVSEQEEEKNYELQVVEIPGRAGFYREVNHGFIVQSTPEGSIIATSIDDNGTERELRDDERKIALSLGIQVTNNDPISLPKETVKQQEEIPTVPQIQNLTVEKS